MCIENYFPLALMIYGYVTNTKVCIIIVVDSSNNLIKNNDIKGVSIDIPFVYELYYEIFINLT